MLREKIMQHQQSSGFRWRGGEIARIEGLSDAVFAFAVTLLVVSLEVPKTFNELAGSLRGFLPFAICFALLMQVWYEQYTFFRRYNLQDPGTIVLNAILLFFVLFYVYPLKFLFSYLINVWTHAGTTVRLPSGAIENVIEPQQLPHLMAIFSAGYLAVACVFMVMFYRALRRREELGLNQFEIFETRASIGAAMVNAVVAAVSLGIAFAGEGGLAGVIYPILIAPGFTIYYSIMGRRRRLLAATLTAKPAA
jgi:uncharacterized membrane protein